MFLLTLTITKVSFSTEQQNEWAILDKDNYKIEYPSDWMLDESGNMGTSFILFSPLVNSEDKFNENVNLMIQDVSTYNLTFEQFVELSEKQIESMLTDGKILSSELVTIDGNNVQKLIFNGKQGEYDLQFEQYYMMRGPIAYVLTFTSEKNEFDKYQEVGEKIMNTFELKK